MDKTAGDALVIADSEGNYYVVPREVLEHSKVRPEARTAVDETLGQTAHTDLGAGFSFVGVMTLPERAEWSHFSPHIEWPNAPMPAARTRQMGREKQ